MHSPINGYSFLTCARHQHPQSVSLLLGVVTVVPKQGVCYRLIALATLLLHVINNARVRIHKGNSPQEKDVGERMTG